jgi:hypothetical protein
MDGLLPITSVLRISTSSCLVLSIDESAEDSSSSSTLASKEILFVRVRLWMDLIVPVDSRLNKVSD